MAEILTSLPAPVAADPKYIAKRTANLKLTRKPMSTDWALTLENGGVLFTIEREMMSFSHRKVVKDSEGQKIYEIRRETWKLNPKYYAETTEGGPRIWEMESEYHISGTVSIIRFTNAANAGNPDQLEFKNNLIGSTRYVTYQGKPVAMIKRKRWQMKHEYDLTVVEGLDVTLILGVLLSMDDKVQTQNSAALAGGISGGATGAAF